MKVCVVGLGEVGLPTALLLATEHEVVGVDIDEELVAALADGEVPTDEPGVRDLHDRVSDRFRPSTRVEPADAHVIVTPTPLEESVGVANLEHVRAATESVGSVLRDGDLVVLESTVPPGTSRRVVADLLDREASTPEFRFAHCPERAIPGNTLEEMVANDRVVGAADEASVAAVRALYGPVIEGDLHVTDPSTAEFVKLVENTYRDVNIGLANEFARIAEEVGVDVHDAIRLANRHPRVEVLRPGPGVGGHCITVDPQFLAQGVSSDRLISVARDVNDSMASHVVGLVRRALGGRSNATLAVFGAAYKGGVSDTRNTPTLPFCKLARGAGYDVRVHDPHVEAFEFELYDREAAVDGADCIVVLTDHDAFKSLDAEALGDRMARRIVVDSRAILDRDRWTRAGFDVHTLGDGRAARDDPDR